MFCLLSSYSYCFPVWYDFLLFPFCILTLLFWFAYWIVHILGIFWAYCKFHLTNRNLSIEEGLPGISIIKPLLGADCYLESNLESFFQIDYSQYEILFCIQSGDDPCVKIVNNLTKKYPSIDTRIFIGKEQIALNPKISNMHEGYTAAKYDMILISDSCIHASKDTLTCMMSCMTPSVGLVYQMPYVCDKDGFFNVIEKIYFGASHARIYLFSDLVGVNATTGMSMMTRKSILEQAGGLKAFGLYLAEDYFIARAVQKSGFQLRMAPRVALQLREMSSIALLHNRMMRWTKLRLAMTPVVTAVEPFSECLLLGALAAFSSSYLLAVDCLLFFLSHVLGWFLLDWIIVRCVQANCTDLTLNKSAFTFAWLLREVYAPILYIRTLFDHNITWQDKIFRLKWGGLIVEPKSATVDQSNSGNKAK